MTWFPAMVRWLSGKPATSPPEVWGETSVLFCLQTKSPMSFEALRAATMIEPQDLQMLLEKLEWQGRISPTTDWHGGVKLRLYSIVYK